MSRTDRPRSPRRIVWFRAALLIGLSLSATGSRAWGDDAVPDPATGAAFVLPAGFNRLSSTGQASWLLAQTNSGALERASDEQLIALVEDLRPAALVNYMRRGIASYRSYQFEMVRRERHEGAWPELADHMLVRYQEAPRRVYARWLPDGRHAGQEILYDESMDAGHALGHFGGLLRFASVSFPIDGVMAHSQSAHGVGDLGLQFAIRMLDHDLASYRAEGLDARPSRVEIVHALSTRLLALTWDAANGPPAHYAARVRLSLDLRHPWAYEEASWDRDGIEQENVRFEHVVKRDWQDGTFSRTNPDYGFR
ncbi:MAG: DUF1571 domain-containing protein [Janthinobacterium lividum]